MGGEKHENKNRVMECTPRDEYLLKNIKYAS
jgi:hypothetical protein